MTDNVRAAYVIDYSDLAECIKDGSSQKINANNAELLSEKTRSTVPVIKFFLKKEITGEYR